MMIYLPAIDPDIEYPDSDGKPMADNTEQYEWIVKIKENIEILFAHDPNVFVAGDLLWYPVRNKRISGPVAPDVMVVFGRPKGRRGSYKQWEENDIAPQVVFEILSPSNSQDEMEHKLNFYQRYGVEEYYVYDPDTNQFDGWTRQEGRLVPITQLNGWVSPRLGVRFVLGDIELEIYRPDGKKFLTSIELAQEFESERQRAENERQRAESERQRAENERQRAENERQRAENERQRAEMMSQQLEEEQQKAQKMAEYLRSLGVDPDRLLDV